MIDGQRRRTLTGHWLTTRVLEEVGRVFSALRCTHRGRGTKKPSLSPFGSETVVRNDFSPARAEHGGAEKDERKHSTARRGGTQLKSTSNSKAVREHKIHTAETTERDTEI